MSLRLINANTLEMKVFVGEDVPPYAILSHTWVQGEELSFQEMVEIYRGSGSAATGKLGYDKILKTCQKAKSHDLEWTWIDTCCIDKSSSAELSEAINSMFKWYQKAEVCYAWLSDLLPESSIEAAMPDCRWFTRGWCLQELLAPDDLRFYDVKWNYIGSKRTLKSLISRVTNIDEDVLTGKLSLRDVPVARRLSWAARRITTRVEDAAYSLFEIFDVNMAMIYGEGNQAFVRLQEEIIKGSNDLSILFSSSTAESPDYTTPVYPRIMTGHDAESEVDWEIERKKVTDLPYRDLLARSPRGFMHCGAVVSSARAVPSQSFTMTNTGMYFKKIELLAEEQTGCYLLPLKCQKRPGSPTCKILLRKVGPGLFVRLRSVWSSVGVKSADYMPVVDDENVVTEVEEVNIINNVTTSIRPLLDLARQTSIRLYSAGTRDLRDALQGASPRDQWDSSRLAFITQNDECFEGYVKIFPHLASLGAGDSDNDEDDSGYFYLACGLASRLGPEGNPDTESNSDYINTSIDHLACWVRLFSAREWKRLEKRLGMMVGLRFVSSGRGRRTTITVGSTRVEAKAGHWFPGDPCFSIGVDFTREPKQKQKA